jgi:predicted DNA-binding transcriptional regulator AlpA
MSAVDETLIPAAQVRARYGGCSDMWIWRRLKGDPDFPRPVYIAKRRFWRLGELVVWERALASRPVAA